MTRNDLLRLLKGNQADCATEIAVKGIA